MSRFSVRRQTSAMDPETEFHEIYRLLASHEFPWDITEALSFALFRTYAVPSIGGLLDRTTEFTDRVQKRYDDTALLLDVILEHGFGHSDGRTAVRRINRMHAAYDISPDDMLYVLSTFVVVPVRWLAAYGWRDLTDNEIVAITNYYRNLGRHMAIPNIPETYAEFATLMDDYERAHFAYDPAAKRVADATLDLLTTFPPNSYAPAGLTRVFARSLMDDLLLDSFGYVRPHPVAARLSRAALRFRGRVVRFLPERKTPFRARDLPGIRSYPNGYRVEELGTFPKTCPVAHHPSDGTIPAASAGSR